MQVVKFQVNIILFVVTLVYPLRFFSVGYEEYFDIEQIDDFIMVNRILNDSELKSLEKIIKNSINKIIDSFSSIKITYDEAIIEYIYKKISNDTGFSNLKLILDDLFLKKITDSVFENKTKVNITLGTIKI